MVVTENNIESIKVLLEYHADVDKTNDKGETPLLFMISKRINIETLEVLLNFEAKVNVADNNGYTPLHYGASLENNFKSLTLLLQHGTNIRAANKRGMLVKTLKTCHFYFKVQPTFINFLLVWIKHFNFGLKLLY